MEGHMFNMTLNISDYSNITNITQDFEGTDELPPPAFTLCTSGIFLMRFICEFCLMLPVAVFGLLGNTLAFCAMWTQRHKHSTTVYLLALAVADELILMSSILCYSLRNLPICFNVFHDFTKIWDEMAVGLFPFVYLLRFASTWLTASLTMDRWIAVCYPLSAQRRCTTKKAYKQIAAIWLISAIYSLPRFFEYELHDGKMRLTHLVKHGVYTILYRISCYFLLMYMIPIVIMVILNTRLLVALKKSYGQREHITSGCVVNKRARSEQRSITAVVIAVVVVFITCNILAMTSHLLWSLHECFSELDHLDIVRRYFANISNVAVTINSAINFLIYCVFSASFRQKCISLFCSSCVSKKNGQKGKTTFSLKSSFTHSFSM